MELSDKEREKLIDAEIVKRLARMDLDDLKSFYTEQTADWLAQWDDDELLELDK